MKKKLLLKSLSSGLTFGAVIGVALFLFNSPDSFTLHQRMMSLLAAAIVGVLSGLFLGFLFFAIETVRAKKFDSLRESLSADGPILAEEQCSRYVDGKRCSGRLFLTDKSFVFRGAREAENAFLVPREEVVSVQITDPRRCIIAFTFSSGVKETFGVVDPRMWFDLLGGESQNEKDDSKVVQVESSAD